MYAHLPAQLVRGELVDVDERFQQLDGGDCDDGPDQLDLEIGEADLAHPYWTILVFARADLRNEVLVAAEADDQQQRGYQRRIDETQNVDDHLVAREREHAGRECPELLQELHEQRDDREDQADEEGR